MNASKQIEQVLIGRLNELAQGLSPQQLAWAGGYFTGLSVGGPSDGMPVVGLPATGDVLTILYGSQTGHAREVATELYELAQNEGIPCELVSMKKYKGKELKKVRFLAVVVSTQGEGEPPEDAQDFYDFLNSAKAPKLEELSYAVLGLGDSSYEFYCQASKDLDVKLESLGGTRLLDRVDLDIDFDDGAAAWDAEVIKTFKPLVEVSGSAAPSVGVPLAGGAEVYYSRKKPLMTQLLACQKITGRDSLKDIRHVEIDLEGSGLTYQPGDSLGIWFRNDEGLVRELLELLNIAESSFVTVDDETREIAEALREQFELTQLHPAFVLEYAELSGSDELKKVASETDSLREYIGSRQIIDVVREHPVSILPEELIGLLRKLTPRLYSIASSQREVEDEVHLTVGVVEYEAHGHVHLGGASGYLGRRLREGEEVLVYVEPNDNFRLPTDSSTPVIMIGPGTGVAPFRAFLQERASAGADGENWLFFGNPHATQDFLYQIEWQDFLESGVLTRLDVAFSRDQEEKVYVQHRIAEQAEELWKWLEKGAHVYVCGDKDRMAHDVHQALLDVAQHQGGFSCDEAESYLSQMRKEGRYQRDVY